MAQPGQGTSSDELRLTDIQVEYLQDIATTRKITVKVGKIYIARKEARKGRYAWNGLLKCSREDRVSVKVYHQYRIPGSWALVGGTMADFVEGDGWREDQSKKIRITISFATVDAASVPENIRQNIQNARDDSSDASQRQPLHFTHQEAREKVKGKLVIADKLGKIYDGVKLAQTVMKPFAQIHSSLNFVVSGLEYVLQKCDQQKAFRDAADQLLDELEFVAELQNYASKLNQTPLAETAVLKMLNLVNDILVYIKEKTSDGVFSDLLSTAYGDKVKTFKAQFDAARRDFDSSLNVGTNFAVTSVEERILLSDLRMYARPANQEHPPRARCMEGTRVALLHRIQEWIHRDSSGTPGDNLFWVTGLPGAGKSSVAGSVAAMVEGAKMKLSYFFCKRDDPSLSSATNILPTLAHGFCDTDISYRSAILHLLRGDDAAKFKEGNIKTQLEFFFRRPLELVVNSNRKETRVIIIDALDECTDSSERQSISSALVDISRAVPWVKIFVTSRTQPEIESVFTNARCKISNISEDDAENNLDIETYVRAEMVRLEIPSATTDGLVTRIVNRAAGLFIWCSTLFKAIQRNFGSVGDLESFLSAKSTISRPEHPLNHLYDLYDQVLEILQMAPPGLKRLKLMLAIVLISRCPLSATAMAQILVGQDGFGANLEENAKILQNILARLPAVLYQEGTVNRDSNQHGAIRIYHPSFLDYLQVMFETVTGWDRPIDIHRAMGGRCLGIMHNQLTFNICELDASLILNRDIPNRSHVVREHISEELQYACEFWTSHLSLGFPQQSPGRDSLITQQVTDLVCTPKVLFWLEVMSLLDRILRYESLLAECSHIFQSTSESIVEASTDLRRFVASFAEAMASVPHIYLSALTWLPSETWTYKNIASLFKHYPLISANGEQRWDALVWSKLTGDPVSCLACSPNGGHVVCGSGNMLQIRDAQTGDFVGKVLEGHSGTVSCVAYSPDGRFIVSGSWDKMLRRWDARTGDAVGEPLKGHQQPVLAVAYSPDHLYVVSASADKTLRRWNVRTGEHVGRLFEGHTSSVQAVCYSPDGKYIVSASDDHTLRKWNAETNEAVGEPLQGHSGCVNAVAYSPDGRRLVSGSNDETGRQWDAATGDPIGKALEGHTDWVRAVAYSPDSQYIISCSDDETLRQWDAATGEALGEPPQGHYRAVFVVAYTPDGRHVVSGSDDGSLCCWDVQSSAASAQHEYSSTSVTTIAYSPDGRYIVYGSSGGTLQILDAKTGAAEPVGQPLRGHAGGVKAVAYSPDSKSIISGADDGTLRQWDAKTGGPEGEPFQGHDSDVLAVAYSPDGHHIVSASADGTVRRWDALTGKAVGEPLRGHRGRVNAVSYSPDGRQIVSGSRDCTLRRWDTETGAALGEPLQGHKSWVEAVAYSPDGRIIVSGSSDGTLRRWDAATGEAVGEPMEGHERGVVAVAYSPDGRFIASGSYDGTLRLWDAATGRAVGEPIWADHWVTSLAFSSDGRHIAYCPESSRSIYLANLVVFHSTSSPHSGLPRRGWSTAEARDALWHACCAAMLDSDGWVKDGNNLLLWIPPKFRADVRKRILYNTETQRATPTVDIEKLFQYAEDWRKIWST